MKTAVKYLLVLVFLGLLAEGVYRICFWPHDRMAYSGPLASQVDRVNAAGADILYLGESSNHTFGLDDPDTAWVSQLLGRHFPGLDVCDITHDASHAEVYYTVLRNLDAASSPSIVVVTMNLRSFGPGWVYSPLETALQKELVMLRPGPSLLNRAALSFKAYDIKSEQQRYAQMDRYWRTHPLPRHPLVPRWADSLCTPTDALPGVFVRNYGFVIDTLHNPRVRDFDRIVGLARQRGWHLVFNLLPENLEWAESLAGPELTALMRSNALLLQQRYERMGVTVVNSVDAVSDSLFRDRDWPTEHYLLPGRQIVADRLAQALDTLAPQHYVP